MPFIRRLSEINESVHVNEEEDVDDSPSIHIFLELLELPEDDCADIDLKQAAVYTITYLDKLVTPHLPVVKFSKVKIIFLNFILNKKYFFRIIYVPRVRWCGAGDGYLGQLVLVPNVVRQ